MYSREDSIPLEEIKNAVSKFRKYKVAVLTGAGISVASGIMPFRGKGGLWEKYDPEEVANIEYFRRNPKNSWVMLKEVLEAVELALPNPAHLALAKMEEMGFVTSIITQNIDGLHQRAGSRTVIEFHGNTSRLVCLGCAALYTAREIDLSDLPPHCPVCEGVLKPDAVFFGESIPRDAIVQAHIEAQHCSVMMVIGTSAMVEPAASLPMLAKRHGALIIEVNPEHSYLTSFTTDLFLQGKSEKILPQFVDELIRMKGY